MKILLPLVLVLPLLHGCSEQTEEDRKQAAENWPQPDQSALTADVSHETPEAVKKLIRDTNDAVQPYLDEAKEEGQRLLDKAKQAVDTQN